jgi:hypothetical protein
MRMCITPGTNKSSIECILALKEDIAKDGTGDLLSASNELAQQPSVAMPLTIKTEKMWGDKVATRSCPQ